MKKKLEICANSFRSALAAQEGGADRIELCYALSEGGVSPSYGEMKLIRKKLNIKINVLIRPRGGDFLYSADEFEVIKQDILIAKELGMNGVVIGVLLPNGKIDKQRTKELVDLAKPMEVTFHRAFDMCENLIDALEDVIETGCNRILTSGGFDTALNGLENLKLLVEKAQNRISIMPGAGISENNISEIARYTNASEFHASAKHSYASAMIYRNNRVPMSANSSIDEYATVFTDVENVKKIVDKLNELTQ